MVKATKKTAARKPYTAEENLKRLGKTRILDSFIASTGGNWDHQGWLDLCMEIEAKGYVPVDFDQVGLMLEAKKAGRCCCNG